MPITRDLFVGLGGTGGKTLEKLYAKMTPEQRENASYVFLDTDQRDINAMQQEGIRSIRISKGKTVYEMAQSLGEEDGVFDWMPDSKIEGDFLNSNIDDGASQFRCKSRLCLAYFLRNPNNELKQMLTRLTPPGENIQNQRLRVIIVSSIAGGTGAGTFIELALYVRKFFMDLQQMSVTITGILGCPDLYTKLVTTDNGPIEQQCEAMYANAYAAIRELNAMNLATSQGATTNDYGKKINIRIDTKSEGKLFDSNDPYFKLNTKCKPFDLIYFVDDANNNGGIFDNIDQYYALMADIAYSRLYSPLEMVIGTAESNELNNHIMAPTAIYGGAGFAKIVYPYEAILRYLAERRMGEDIDSRWRHFDDEWSAECESEQDIAAQEGRIWNPDENLRGRRFVEGVKADLDDPEGNSEYAFLEDMVRVTPINYRTELYLAAIKKASAPGSVASEGSVSGRFSIVSDSAVSEAVQRLVDISNRSSDTTEEEGDDEEVRNQLLSISQDAEQAWPAFENALKDAVSGKARALVNAIFPMTDTARQFANKNRLDINLHWGLLCLNGNKNVHPIAARFLLYDLYNRLDEIVNPNGVPGGAKATLSEDLASEARALRLAFDDDLDDDNDLTVEMHVARLSRGWTRGRRLRAASEALATYKGEILAHVDGAIDSATAEMRRTAYKMLLEPLGILIKQYEAFFENLDTYSDSLRRKTNTDLRLHDRSTNQIVFVGASSKVKQIYYSKLKPALERSSIECFDAAGAGVFEFLEDRTVKKIEEAKIARATGDNDGDKRDRFEDMGVIFDTIIEKYIDSLRESASILRTDAVGALVNEICSVNDLKEEAVTSDPRARNIFREAFRVKIADLSAKALPMIRYNSTNIAKYFADELDNAVVDRSEEHVHFGLSPSTASRVANYFPTANQEDELSEFKTFIGTNSVTSSDAYSDYEMFCFRAVHCLQPPQIYHFDELAENSYFDSYKNRVHMAINSGKLSLSPHIDKRWHLKGAMPFISKQLEIQWRHRIMMAFIHQILTRRFTYTIDRNGKNILLHKKENGERVVIEFPEGDTVVTRNISRLVAYLAQDEMLVEHAANEMEALIEARIKENVNYAETVGLYKTGMTTDPVLKRMREDALHFVRIKNGQEPTMTDKERALADAIYRSRLANLNDIVEDDDEQDELTSEPAAKPETDPQNQPAEPKVAKNAEVFNYKATMGSILRVAYRLHMSEEKLAEDMDFGEALLETVLEVIDTYAQGMYGPDHVNNRSMYHNEYVEIYNWAMDRFLESYVKQLMFEMKIDPNAAVNNTNSSFTDDDDLIPGRRNKMFKNIPAQIQNTEEFSWIMANWKHKSE